MLATLPIENLGGVNGVYKIWVDTGKLVFKQDSENVNLSESATAVMRAALDKIKFRENGNTGDSSLFSELALSDIEVSHTYSNMKINAMLPFLLQLCEGIGIKSQIMLHFFLFVFNYLHTISLSFWNILIFFL